MKPKHKILHYETDAEANQGIKEQERAGYEPVQVSPVVVQDARDTRKYYIEFTVLFRLLSAGTPAPATASVSRPAFPQAPTIPAPLRYPA